MRADAPSTSSAALLRIGNQKLPGTAELGETLSVRFSKTSFEALLISIHVPAPADGLGTSLRATIRRSMTLSKKRGRIERNWYGAVNRWMRPLARLGPISTADVSPSATFALA